MSHGDLADYEKKILFEDDELKVESQVEIGSGWVYIFFSGPWVEEYVLKVSRKTAYSMALTLEERSGDLDPYDDVWMKR